jgi:hypothetical protein
MRFTPAQTLSRHKLACTAALFVVLVAMPCGFDFGQPGREMRFRKPVV